MTSAAKPNRKLPFNINFNPTQGTLKCTFNDQNAARQKYPAAETDYVTLNYSDAS